MWLRAVAVTAVLLGGLATVGPAQGQDLNFSCFNFGVQEDAQVLLDGDPTDPMGLDPDGNGIACEDLPNRSATPPTPEIPQDILDNPPSAPAAGDGGGVSRGGDAGLPSSPAGGTATTVAGAIAGEQPGAPAFGPAGVTTTLAPGGSAAPFPTADIAKSSDRSTLMMALFLLPVLGLLVLLYLRRRDDPEVD